MHQNTVPLLFTLLCSAICDKRLQNAEKELISDDILQELYALSKKHDLAHLVALGLKNNTLSVRGYADFDKASLTAIYRYSQLSYEYEKLCDVLENAGIPFLPLKGSVLRNYYPEPWMRTSCDIDILVHEADAEKVAEYLVGNYEYSREGKGSHDISLFSPGKVHVELHYDLVEEGLANRTSEILQSVWDRVLLKEGKQYWYEMPDELFYFYHIAHMAKHFENGGCGIRPFIDLWILDHVPTADVTARRELLERGELLQFAECSQRLSCVWLENEINDNVTEQMSRYILHGGIYGSTDNRVMLQNPRKGGKSKYLLSKIFIPYGVIKFHYPILQKHRWLTPFMEVRRWFKLIFCGHIKRVKHEMSLNANITFDQAEQSKQFLKDVGLI